MLRPKFDIWEFYILKTTPTYRSRMTLAGLPHNQFKNVHHHSILAMFLSLCFFHHHFSEAIMHGMKMFSQVKQITIPKEVGGKGNLTNLNVTNQKIITVMMVKEKVGGAENSLYG